MKIISVRQPWAWAIINAGKDIENRSWPTKLRGRILVHASLKHDGLDATYYMHDILRILRWSDNDVRDRLSLHPVERGGIIGSAEVVDCIARSASPWFVGPYGFVLRDPRPLPFIPLRGRLGFFDAPADVMEKVLAAA